MFGISAGELVVLFVVAAVVLGPERLPDYAAQLARLVRELRRMARGATDQVRSEMGPEFDDIDWRKLDPRQYDPRRIVREALTDVWDPDDPLGLKDDERDEKPVSPGGPMEAARQATQDGEAQAARMSRTARLAEAKARSRAAAASRESAPDYDTDAT